ncbi:PREDICTED: syntaxin-23-like isoform X2 [Camelina sativa]|uniref:Syntaxin-23-like isoform X2 n=1 Tax=Camelina sativa TaxID=90675 RepID=A0ABM0SPJ3_CAMSA|nr:PREDICTED: syntaxin-23-like isoform X2 [Camelina sativa]
MVGFSRQERESERDTKRMSFQDLEAGRGRSLASLMNINGGGRQDTTQAVASGVFQINTSVSTFHRLVNSLGTPKDTLELRDKLRKTILHIGQLVKDTSAKLKKVSETDHERGVDQRKKIVEVAKDFQAVLNEFQKAQRLAAERETVYAPLVHKPSLPSSYRASEAYVNAEKDPRQQALLLESKRQELALLDKKIAFNDASIEDREQKIQAMQQKIGEVHEIFKDMGVLVHNEEAMIDENAEKYPEQQVLLLESKRQELALLDKKIAFNNASIEEREQKIQEMQQTIGEVHEIFKDMAVLVHNEETISEIDTRMSRIHNYLARASKTQRSNSSLACLLLVIFGIVLLIVIVVLAVWFFTTHERMDKWPIIYQEV